MMVNLSLFRRELVRLSRHRPFYIVRALWLLLLLGGFIYIMVENISYRMYEYSALGAYLFWLLIWTLLVISALVLPPLIVAMVHDELEQDTLPLVMLTDLGASRVLLQKLAARLAWLGLLMIGAAPFAVCLLITGGVDVEMLWLAARALGAVLICATGMSLLLGALTRNRFAAILLSYLATAFVTWRVWREGRDVTYSTYDGWHVGDPSFTPYMVAGVICLLLGVWRTRRMWARVCAQGAVAAGVVPKANEREDRHPLHLRSVFRKRWMLPLTVAVVMVAGTLLPIMTFGSRSGDSWTTYVRDFNLFHLHLASSICWAFFAAAGYFPRCQQGGSFQLLLLTPQTTGWLLKHSLQTLLTSLLIWVFIGCLMFLPTWALEVFERPTPLWQHRWQGLLLWCGLMALAWLGTLFLLVMAALLAGYRRGSGTSAMGIATLLVVPFMVGALAGAAHTDGYSLHPLPPLGFIHSLGGLANYLMIVLLGGGVFLGLLHRRIERDRTHGYER